jgi:hypothetical protein
MVARGPQVFTTDQLTALLGLDPKRDKWRVIKFAESREYNIKPSISAASGSGSRRLYGVDNVCEFALALRLLETGLRSKVIGRAIRQLRKRGKLSAKIEMEDSELENLKLVIARIPDPGKPLNETREQEVNFRKGVESLTGLIGKAFRDPINEFDMILVPIGSTFLGLKKRLAQLRAELAKENL